LAELFQSLRKDALWIARSVEAWPDDGSDRSARAKLIADTLSETFHDRIPGEPDWAPAYFEFEEEYLDLRRRWSDITLSDRTLKPLEKELEAAIALIMAHSEVLACFDVNEHLGYFWGIFSFDILGKLEQDAKHYGWISERQRRSWRELIYAPPSALALLIGAADTLDGNDGVASSLFLAVGFIGLVCSFGAWRNWKKLSEEASALEKKWGNRAPTRIDARS
jgi:hypothetical protein